MRQDERQKSRLFGSEYRELLLMYLKLSGFLSVIVVIVSVNCYFTVVYKRSASIVFAVLDTFRGWKT